VAGRGHEKTCNFCEKVAPLASGGTGGLARPTVKTARPSSQYNALIVVSGSAKCSDQGHASTCDLNQAGVFCVAGPCAIATALPRKVLRAIAAVPEFLYPVVGGSKPLTWGRGGNRNGAAGGC